jgi:hypothetical protein
MRSIGSFLRDVVDEAERLSERRLSDEHEPSEPAPQFVLAVEEDEFDAWN